MRWLDYSIPDRWYIDLIRAFVVITAGCMIGFSIARMPMRAKYMAMSPLRTRLLLMTIALVGVLLGLQEAEQLGRRMLVWRLPLCAAICACAWSIMLGSGATYTASVHDRRAPE